MRRREFITLVGGAAVAWPLAARAEGDADLVVDGVPLPSEASVASVPKSATELQRRWSGVWVGAWNGALKHILLVERIGEDGTAGVVYAEADNPYTEFKARWWRSDAVVSGRTLTVKGPLFTATYDMDDHGQFGALYKACGRMARAAMSRTDLASLTKSGAVVAWSRGISELLQTDLQEDGIPIRLETVFFKPAGPGPFPLAVFNHGSTGAVPTPGLAKQTWVSLEVVDFLTKRGWLVAFPQRRGRGKSEGLYDEGVNRISKLVSLKSAAEVHSIGLSVGGNRGGKMKRKHIIALLLGTSALLQAGAVFAASIDISAHDIGGQVTGDKGPEAGVWVIAETKDLPTRYAKVVVTDDQGRFVIPDLPDANYNIWVRGYGLRDTAKIDSHPGKLLDFTAAPAVSATADAQVYPAMYWYSMLDIPKPEEFPGTGDKGNQMPPTMKSQAQWVDTVKNMCQSCHSIGSRGIREVPKIFMGGNTSHIAWAYRTQAGQAMEYMAVALNSMGPEKVFSVFSQWTDRIAAGELPFDKPERPKGVERNVVFTMWDWASPKHYQHDAISTDKRNPTVNANGLIYGSPEESTDLVPTLDPVRNIAATIKHPYLDPKTPSSEDAGRGPSAYWDDEPIWDGHTSIHNVIMDEAGKVWFTARLRPAENPDYCKSGSPLASAKVDPQATSLRQLSRFDPITGKWDLINTCFTTHHLYFGHDADNTLWTSSGGPGLGGGLVGWLDTKKFRETLDAVASQGWTPLIIDTNGNGKRDDYAGSKEPLDPTKDKQVMASFYGIMPSPVDDSIWGQSMDRGFSRIDQPGYIIRVTPGPDPTNTALAEIYQPPEGTFGPRGIDLGFDGVVWTALSSGHLASFDRRLCKGPLNGPTTAEGRQCPEGWKVYRMPGPQFKGLDPNGSANHAYYVWVDRYNVLGLGANVPLATANGGEAVLALVNEEFVNLRVPYPLGFFVKNFDGRIDDANAGWKGRGIWTTSGTRANFHSEGGVDAYPKVYKVQMRPDPLAH